MKAFKSQDRWEFLDGTQKLDVASNRCLIIAPWTLKSKLIRHRMDINSNNKASLLLRFGAHSAGEIPVSIPNTEVKPSSADYTAYAGN